MYALSSAVIITKELLLSLEGANALAEHLDKILKSSSLDKTVHTSASTSEKFTVSETFNFTDSSCVVFRLSTQGDAVRMYVERYVSADAGPAELAKPAAEGLKGLIEVALEISKLQEFLGRDEPMVTAVSLQVKLMSSICYVSFLTMTDFLPPKSNHCQYNGEHIEYIIKHKWLLNSKLSRLPL